LWFTSYVLLRPDVGLISLTPLDKGLGLVDVLVNLIGKKNKLSFFCGQTQDTAEFADL
jgi:hypothetical protein